MDLLDLNCLYLFKMMTVQRLNQDSSWKITINGQRFLLDPWLIGSEIDGFSWFNEQWHRTPPVGLADIGEVDFVVVSQPFSDHCHEQTLQLLSPELPLLLVPAAQKRLAKTFGDTRSFFLIPEWKRGFLDFSGLQLSLFKTSGLLDQVHNGLLILSPDGNNIFYAPHGFVPNAAQVTFLQKHPIHLLIATVSAYHLPFFLGGTVNLGLRSLEKLAQVLRPKHILSTHDEQKHAKGLVPKIARTFYPDAAMVSAQQPNFIALNDYQSLELG
jgi:L-ascorbate metabolism protein UlaG (beta-lactamase superfamily)